jgi:hypothetical protein
MLSWGVIGYGAALSAVVVTVPRRFRPTRAHARQCWNVRQLAPYYIFVGRWAVLPHVADGVGVLKQTTFETAQPT